MSEQAGESDVPALIMAATFERIAERHQRDPKSCPECGEVCKYDGWGHVHADGVGIGSCAVNRPGQAQP